MLQEATDRYLIDKVMTASPAELVGILFDAGVKALLAAGEAARGRQPALAHRCLVRAQDVVTELRCSLDLDTGDLARRLDAIYAFLLRLLVEANLRKDPALVEQGLAILVPLREAWRDACLRPVGAAS